MYEPEFCRYDKLLHDLAECTPVLKRQDLERHRKVIRYLDERLQVLTGDFSAAYRSPQRALVDDDPQLRSIGPAVDLLAAD